MCGAVRYYNISKIKNTEKSEGYKNENRKSHFEREMEKNIELANGIGLGCREAILAEMKAQDK